MSPQINAAIEVQAFFNRRGWRYCIIGGMALIRWGDPRATLDVDLSLLVELGREKDYVEGILSTFTSRIDDARQFAIQNRVLLVTASNGVPLDISLAALPFEERMIKRASEFEFTPRVKLVTTSAADLVTLKAFAGRDQDWLDIKGVIVRQGAALDWQLIDTELELLCNAIEEPEPLDRLRELRHSLQSGV
jgi:hypothetical protein